MIRINYPVPVARSRLRCLSFSFFYFVLLFLCLADAELQLITGHARRETLAVYQHVGLDGDLEAKYQATMKEVEL